MKYNEAGEAQSEVQHAVQSEVRHVTQSEVQHELSVEKTGELVQYADEQTQQRAGAPGTHTAFDRLVRTIWRLRQSDGCPWDKEQTHQSIAKNMLEEAYEAFDALNELGAEDNSSVADHSATQNNIAHLQEELGDVLMQVVIHAQIASDANEFTIDDICEQLNKKLVRRHPHIFADQHVQSVDDVLALWEKVKDEERERSGQTADRSREAKPEGLLDSIPKTFPALMQAQKVGKRLQKAGLSMEELCLKQAATDANALTDTHAATDANALTNAPVVGSFGVPQSAEAFGELLFLLTQHAQQQGIDAETALRAYTSKLIQRWSYVEDKAWEAKGEASADPTESDALTTDNESCKQWWRESKAIIETAEQTRS